MQRATCDCGRATCDVRYPHKEGTGAGVVVIAEHFALCILLFLAPHVDYGVMNLLCLGGLAACPFVMLGVSARQAPT